MSKNYTNYSNKSVNKEVEKEQVVAEETVEEQVVEAVEENTEEAVETPVEETTEEVVEEAAADDEILDIGVVTDCLKLNVRKQPSKDAEVLKTIDALTEVVILKEVNDFYEVALKTGESGYCMKKYIAVNK